MTTLTTMRAALDALDIQQTGLQWYRDAYPVDHNGDDDEADAKVSAAENGLRTLIAEMEAGEPKPLPGADWTITMRRMMGSGCAKLKCTCKAGDEKHCIWWDEPGDRPAQPVEQPLTEDEIYAALEADIIAIESSRNDPESWAVIVEMVRAIEQAIRSK